MTTYSSVPQFGDPKFQDYYLPLLGILGYTYLGGRVLFRVACFMYRSNQGEAVPDCNYFLVQLISSCVTLDMISWLCWASPVDSMGVAVAVLSLSGFVGAEETCPRSSPVKPTDTSTVKRDLSQCSHVHLSGSFWSIWVAAIEV